MAILYFALSAASGTAPGPGFFRAAPRGRKRVYSMRKTAKIDIQYFGGLFRYLK